MTYFVLTVSDIVILNIRADGLFQQSSGLDLLKKAKEVY